MPVGRRLGQGGGTLGLFQAETDRNCLGLVILLSGQPLPRCGRTRADAGYQGGGARQLLLGALQGLLQRLAVCLGRDDLNDLCRGALAQVQQLLVA
ncbi:hypothetical protein D3C80_1057000 [compost metagenome]